MGNPNGEASRIEAQIVLALGQRSMDCCTRCMWVGIRRCRLRSLNGPFGQQTFLEFLWAHGLTALVGSLQYSYEVQGYGPLKDIPAYSGCRR